MKTKKTLILILAMLMINISLSAQNIHSVVNKYGNNEEFQLVNVNNLVISFASLFTDKEVGQILRKISNVKILTSDNSIYAQELMNEIKEITTLKKYENLLEVRDKGEVVNIYYKELKKNRAEILILNKEKTGEINLVVINGNITSKEFEKLNSNDNKIIY